ncbi:MAG TPA: YidC/Oxa1 family membrane protein insertase [Candidatus Paceibacterota bacterium]|nr:YidC/Oxa1 family membrane protein insertase [Candidatus Paceibacterota bacterium]
MFSFIWHTFFFDPVYNALVFFISVIPGGDVGLAIVATTVVVKFILLPLSVKATKTQVIMRELEPKLKVLKETYKDDREAQAREMMALYREAGLNPFASILLIFLQIPIIIALYLSVYSGGGVALPDINTNLLYPIVAVPALVSMFFLGVIDMAGRSLPLALLAGVTQFFQAKYAMPAPEPRQPDAEPNFKDDFQRTMHAQMRYVLPIVIFFVAYTISAAIALYFVVSNLFAIAQELYVRRFRN